MHEGGRLKRLARTLLSQLRCRQLAQLVINQGEQLLRGMGIALFNRREDGCNFVHAARNRLEPSGGFAPRYLIEDWQAMTQGADRRRASAGVYQPALPSGWNREPLL